VTVWYRPTSWYTDVWEIELLWQSEFGHHNNKQSQSFSWFVFSTEKAEPSVQS
jgi:hypothetical protein